MFDFNPIYLLYALPAILISLSFHELSHGLAATMLGDPTPRLQGRLTLNPLKHLDPVGTIMLALFHFGWAKPVMFNPLHFKGNRKLGILWVALAGPLSNFILALAGAGFISLMVNEIIPPNNIFMIIFIQFVRINLILGIFNLIPVPPLDGSKILAAVLPNQYANWIYSAGQYSMIIIMVLIITGLLDFVINPLFNGMVSFLSWITQCDYLVHIIGVL